MAKKTLSDEQRASLNDLLRKVEMSFFVQNKTLAEAREALQKTLGFGFSHKDFDVARNEVCKWYKTVKRKPKSTNTTLSNEGWEKLRFAVSAMKSHLLGRTLKEAVEIVSTKCSCSALLLNNLHWTYRVWEKPKGSDRD